jgi:hypothetical protein
VNVVADFEHNGIFEILFFRSLVSFVIVLAAPSRRYGIGAARERPDRPHTTRSVLHTAGQFAWV